MTFDDYNSTNSKSLAAYGSYAPKEIVSGTAATCIAGDGVEYLDLGMALGSVLLGYANPEVDSYVIEIIKRGINFSRPSSMERLLSEKISAMIDQNDTLVRYAKSSSVLAASLPRVTRAITGKQFIAYPKNCFLGNADWYHSKNYNHAGTLTETKEKTKSFTNGCIRSLNELFTDHGTDLAMIIMEPYRDRLFSSEFYLRVRELCDKYQTILVFDETVTGFRFFYPLAQYQTPIQSDLTIVGKAIANGYSIAGLIGKQHLLREIETQNNKGYLFDFSTTHAGENVGLAASIITTSIISRDDVVGRILASGRRLKSNLQKVIEHYDLAATMALTGHESYFKIEFGFDSRAKLARNLLLKHFYKHNILCRGVMALSIAHTDKQLQRVTDSFEDYCRNLSESSRCIQN